MEKTKTKPRGAGPNGDETDNNCCLTVDEPMTIMAELDYGSNDEVWLQCWLQLDFGNNGYLLVLLLFYFIETNNKQ